MLKDGPLGKTSLAEQGTFTGTQVKKRGCIPFGKRSRQYTKCFRMSLGQAERKLEMQKESSELKSDHFCKR